MIDLENTDYKLLQSALDARETELKQVRDSANSGLEKQRAIFDLLAVYALMDRIEDEMKDLEASSNGRDEIRQVLMNRKIS